MRKLFSDPFEGHKKHTIELNKNLYNIFKYVKKPTAIVLAIFISLQPLMVFAQQSTQSTQSTEEINVNAPTEDAFLGPEPLLDESASPESLSTNNEVIQEPTSNTESKIPDNASITDPQPLDNTKNSNLGENQVPQTLLTTEEGYDGPVDTKAKEVGQRLALTDEHTGALINTIPITLPPGRNGMQPSLQLSYSSQNQEDGSIVGYGWSINIPYIERLNKMGTNMLYSTSSPVFFNSFLDGELSTTTSTTTFTAQVENGDMRSYIFSNNQWVVTDNRGIQYKFGQASSTQQTSSSTTSQVFRWMLDEVRDQNNNFVRYTYFKDNGQVYPDTIYYTGTSTQDGIFKVEFLREARNDTLPSFKTGFEVKSTYRISQIKVYVNNSLVRKYDLTYIAGNNGIRSLLNSVQESGYAEGSSTPQVLPATTFTYQTTNEGFSSDGSRSLPNNANLNFEFGDKMFDVNGDGLVDYISRWTIGPQSNNIVYLQKPDGTWATSTTYTIPFDLYYTTFNSFHYATPHIEDINGDGRVDLVENTSVYINTGSNWVLDSNWNLPVVNETGNVMLADVNSDGLPDLMNDSNQGLTPAVYLNLGDKWDSASSTFTSQSIINDAAFQFADQNNDGIVDVLKSAANLTCTGTSTLAQFGNGVGGFVDASTTPPILFAGNNNYCFPYDRGTALVDIDGDGVKDIFQGNTSTGQKAYQGSGQGWIRKINWEPNVNLAESNHATYSRIVDLNGDGLPDFWNGGALINNNKKADLLTKINYPTGGFSAVTYKPSTQYATGGVSDNPNLPTLVYTAQKIETSNGTATSTSDTYVYKGGNYYFLNPWERKFAGFEQILKTDALGNVTKTYFHTASSTDSSNGEYLDNYYKIGKPYRVEKYDSSGNLFEKTINKWDTATTSNTGFVKLAQTVVSSYDGAVTHKDKAETYTYNNTTGNITQRIEYGEVTGSNDGTFTDTGTDDFTTNYTYATSSTSSVISLLATESTVDHSSTKVKESRYYYDNLALGIVNLGNLTKKEDWKTGSTYVDIEKTYNGYGLVTSDKDPRDKTTTYTYDAYNLYPTTITNPLSHVSQFTYDYSSGRVATTTDPNGNIFVNTFDGFDRVLAQKQPDPSATSTLLTAVSYNYTDAANSAGIQKSVNLDGAIVVDSYVYFDGLGRKIQERGEATSTLYTVKDFVYNSVGLLQKESLPYFSIGSSTTTATTTNELYTHYSYDALNRVIRIVTNVGTTTNAYLNWKTTITDPRGGIKHYYRDAYGNLVKVEEQLNAVATPATPVEINDTSLLNDANIVSYYRLEGNSTDTKGNYNGSDNSMSYGSSYGKFNQGAYFSGSGRVNIGTVFQNKTTFWIHGWVNVQSVPGLDVDNALWGSSSWSGPGNFICWIRGTGSGQFKFKIDLYGDGAGEIYTTSNYNGSTWYMVDFAVDTVSKVRKIYINGVEQATVTGSSGVTLSQTTTYLGYNGGQNNYFTGYMDDVAVFTRVPTTTDLSTLIGTESSTTPLQTTTYTYNGLGNLLSITDAASNVRNFTYDGLGRRLTAQDLHAPGDMTYGSYSYSYDDASNLTQKTDPKNQIVDYTYDDANRVLTENYTGQAGTEVSYVYDTCTQGKGRLCTSSSTVVTILNAYNALGQLIFTTSTISSISYVTSYTYDRLGNKLTITSPDASVVRYVYNSGGLVTQVQRKESTDGAYIDVVKQINYNPVSLATEIYYANSAKTVNTYDPSQLYRLTHKVTTIPVTGDGSLMSESPENEASMQPPVQQPEWFEEVSTSTPTSTLETLASTTPLTATSSKDSSTPVSLYGGGYFAKLWNVFVGILGMLARYIASSLDVKTALASAIELYNTTLYNDSNLQAYYRLENTNDSKNSNNLTNNGSVPFNAGQFYNGSDFGTSGNTKSLRTTNTLGIDGGNISMVCWVKKNVNLTSGKYANAIYQANGSGKIEYRLGIDNSSGTEKIVFSRGKIGLADNDAITTYSWSAGDWHHMAGTYDGTYVRLYLDGVQQATTTSSGWGTNMVYTAGTSIGNNNNSSSFIENVLLTDDCAVFNRVLTNAEISHLYTGAWTDETRIQDLSYTYDANSNISRIQDTSATNAAKTTNYAYDELNRLTSASSTGAVYGGNYNNSYTYDALGNMLSRTENGTTTAYTYATNTTAYLNPHAPQKMGNATSTYDNNGNLLAVITSGATSTAYSWDYNNRLINASSSGVSVGYSYDPWGQRIKQTQGATTTVYSSRHYNITGSNPTKSIFLPDGTLIATVTGTGASSTVAYIHTDHLGGTNVATDDIGNVVELTDYYPYGSTRIDEQTGLNSQRKYIGEIYDPNTGLNYLNARYYNGNTGKFTSQDPEFWNTPKEYIVDPQQWNSYSYGRDNPIKYKDPTGKCVDGVTTAVCVFAWVALTAIFSGIGIETYGAYKGDAQIIELGQGTRAIGEIGGAGLLEARGSLNPITGVQGTKVEVKSNKADVVIKKGSTPESILNVSDTTTTIRVGRWMSQTEYEAMVKTGIVQEGGGGVTYVSTSGSESFGKQAPPGSLYVEFDVPQNSLTPGSKPDQPMIVGPNAGSGPKYSAENGGSSVGFPQAKNITVKGKK